MSTFNKSWRRGVVALAVTAALGLASTVTYAAGENTSGIIGTIQIGSGSINEYSIKIRNTATGFERELQLDDMSFRFPQLPVGSYEVTVMKGGAVVARDTVHAGIASNAVTNFDLSTNAGAEVIEVVGARPSAIDLTTTDSGLILGESQMDVMPVARSLTGVALLAPGTIQGEARFGDLPSFGGASVSENSCYLNGLEITDTRQGLGCGNVPFEFYKEFQIKTGGYSAAFGRTTGGVINAVTKSGSNNWEFAATANIRPSGLQEKGSISRASGGTGSAILGAFRDYSQDSVDLKEATISASGPLVEDKVFVYAIVNPRWYKERFSGVSGNASRTGTNRLFDDEYTPSGNTFWGTKLDWQINDSHSVGIFGFSTKREVDRDVSTYVPSTGVETKIGEQISNRGSEAHSLNYTGRFTDSLTVSAMVGEIDTDFLTVPTNTTCPNVTDSRNVPVSQRAPTCFVGNNGTNFDHNEQQRLDVEWFVGDFIVRGGLDFQTRESEQTTIPSGGAAYTYETLQPGGSVGGTLYINNTGAAQDVVGARVFTGGGGFETDMKAFYVEGEWQATSELSFKLGVRNDQLTNYGTTGIAFADFAETAPRLGMVWDPSGDGTSKVYSTWGRYFLPIPNNTNYRMASGVADATTYYHFAGPTATFDSIGAPTGITPVNGTVDNSTNVNSLPVFPNTDTTQAKEATPFYKDEFIVGYEREVSEEYKASVRFVARDVASALDDYCGDLAPACVLLNPGEGGTWGNDADGDGQADAGSIRYHTAEEIGLPEAKNEYRALQFQVDRQSAETNWSFIYTWSRSYGNFEGAVKSDIAQADAGITQDFDFPALMDGADGYQANDRRHVFKFFGSHKLTEDLSIGWNSSLSSGRPLSTFGRGYPSTDPHVYGSYGDTFYLYTGQCPDSNGNNTCDPSERVFIKTNRGDAGRTPWTFNLNLSLDYDFSVSGVEMRASLDVFNVLNSQEVIASNEHYESATGTRNQFYGSAYAFQTPRYVQVGFEARF